MRHSHPAIFYFAFGFPLVIGLIAGAKNWISSPADTPLFWLIAKTFLLTIAPLLSIFAFVMLGGGIALYLGTFRAGNRVKIEGGEHDGKVAVVTKYHGVTTPGWVNVRIPSDELDTTISPYHLQKTGLWAYIF